MFFPLPKGSDAVWYTTSEVGVVEAAYVCLFEVFLCCLQQKQLVSVVVVWCKGNCSIQSKHLDLLDWETSSKGYCLKPCMLFFGFDSFGIWV